MAENNMNSKIRKNPMSDKPRLNRNNHANISNMDNRNRTDDAHSQNHADSKDETDKKTNYGMNNNAEKNVKLINQSSNAKAESFINGLKTMYLKEFKKYASDDGWDDLQASKQDWLDSLKEFGFNANSSHVIGAILALLPVIVIQDDGNPEVTRETAIAMMLSLLDYSEKDRPVRLPNKLVRNEKADADDVNETNKLVDHKRSLKEVLESSTNIDKELLDAMVEAYGDNPDSIDNIDVIDNDNLSVDIGGITDDSEEKKNNADDSQATSHNTNRSSQRNPNRNRNRGRSNQPTNTGNRRNTRPAADNHGSRRPPVR